MRTVAIALIATIAQAAEFFQPHLYASESADMQGTYSDPNHPGCPRAFIVDDATTGEMYGNDDCVSGKEPWGPLPVKISDDYSILVDFSSKGGPTDLPGTYTKDEGAQVGKIPWSDGNVWTQIPLV